MNSESKKNNSTAILLSIVLAAVLLSNLNIGSVFATGGLDDEEEEEAIKELQSDVKEINESIDGFSLDLKEGLNDIDATCPTTPEEPVTTPSDPVIEEEEQTPPTEEETETENNGSSSSGGNQQVFVCQAIANEEEEDPATGNNNNTVAPPITPEEPTCQAIPEPEPEPEPLPPLEPIYCPYNGDLLGYKNITSGELLPISAGENQTQTTEETEEQEVNTGNGGGFLPPSVINEGQGQEEQQQPVSNIEFDEGCGCFVVNGSGVNNDTGISEGQNP